MDTTILKASDSSLTARIEDGRVVFSGGRFGECSLVLTVSSPERVKAHWEGYCEANGAKAVTADEKIRVRGLTRAQVSWCFRAINDAGYDTEHDPSETITWGATYIEGTPEDIQQVYTSLIAMTGLIEEDPAAYAFTNNSPTHLDGLPEWMVEKLTDQALKCCEEAMRKIRKV
jgi:hypothetical protein